MARSRRNGNERSLIATFLAVSFVLGALLGAVLATTWVQGLPALQLSQEGVYTRSITIVGVDKNTGQGRLATFVVELRAGAGRLLVSVPPYENEDTQAAALDARRAAEHETGYNFDQVDIIVSVENISSETTIAGPSASASMAVLIVAAVNASDNQPSKPNQVRQDVVVSASIDSVGRLKPVGQITEKYETVREAGIYSRFVVAEGQPGNLPSYPDISVVRALNLDALADVALQSQ